MQDDVRWIRSYVTAEPDGTVGTVCIYQASSPEAIRRTCEQGRTSGRRDRQGRRHGNRAARPGSGSRLRGRGIMRKKLLLGGIVAVLPVLAIAGFAAAGGGQSSLADLRQATAAYHDIAVARDAGYTVELEQTAAFGGGTCIANGTAGAMGIHLLSPDRVDGTLDPADPEALLYGRRNDGTLKLTGVEYIVAGGPQPELYGQKFSDTNLGRFGNPARTSGLSTPGSGSPTRASRSGIFSPWNPRVSCP